LKPGARDKDERNVIFEKPIYDRISRILTLEGLSLCKKIVNDSGEPGESQPQPGFHGNMSFSPRLWISCQAPCAQTEVIAADSKSLQRQNTGPKLAGNLLGIAILKIWGKNEIFAPKTTQAAA
jgi:hypothetical protein